MEPQAVPQSQIPPVPPTPKINNSLIFIMSILLIVTVGIAGLFYFQIQKLSKELSKYQTQASPTQTATTDPTANWKTYTDPKNTYFFKYPSSFFPLITENNSVLFFENQTAAKTYDNCIKNRLGTLQNPCSGIILSVGLSIKISSSLNSGSPDLIKELVDSQNRTWKTEGPVPGIEGAANYTAEYKFENNFYSVDMQIGEAEFAKYLGKTLIIENPKGTFDYSPESKEFKDFGDQILSTFKFIEATPSASPTASPTSSQ